MKENRVSFNVNEEELEYLNRLSARIDPPKGRRRRSIDAALYSIFAEHLRRIRSPSEQESAAVEAEASGNDPLAGLSTEDVHLVSRLIAAIRSGAFEDSQTIDRLLRAFEATHKDETETTAKGKKHRRSA